MNCFYAGGNYNGNAAKAGVFALNGNNPRSNSNVNIGFRSALSSFVRYIILTGMVSELEV